MWTFKFTGTPTNLWVKTTVWFHEKKTETNPLIIKLKSDVVLMKIPTHPFCGKIPYFEFPLNQYLNFNPTSATASSCVSQDPHRVAAWPPLVFGPSAPWRGRRGWDRCGRCGDCCGAGDGGELGMGSAVSAKGHREGNEALDVDDVGDGPWCFFGFGDETAVGGFRVWTWFCWMGLVIFIQQNGKCHWGNIMMF